MVFLALLKHTMKIDQSSFFLGQQRLAAFSDPNAVIKTSVVSTPESSLNAEGTLNYT